jgi:hypothetical protein
MSIAVSSRPPISALWWARLQGSFIVVVVVVVVVYTAQGPYNFPPFGRNHGALGGIAGSMTKSVTFQPLPSQRLEVPRPWFVLDLPSYSLSLKVSESVVPAGYILLFRG